MILFLLVSLYFAVFNWQVFIVKLNVNLGFGIVSMPPFIVLFLASFLIIGILSWLNYLAGLRRMIYNLEHGVEVGRLKDQLGGNRIQKFLQDEKNLEQLKAKLEISSLKERQEELFRLVNAMKEQETGKQKVE